MQHARNKKQITQNTKSYQSMSNIAASVFASVAAESTTLQKCVSTPYAQTVAAYVANWANAVPHHTISPIQRQNAMTVGALDSVIS